MVWELAFVTLASGLCVDDPSFVDAFDWTCRDYGRLAVACDTASEFTNGETGIHAGDACCVCRRRRQEAEKQRLAVSFGEEVIRRRQTTLTGCYMECSNDASNCGTNCQNRLDTCTDQCDSAKRTCNVMCDDRNQATAQPIDAGVVRDPSTPAPGQQPSSGDEGMPSWVIILIVIFVLLALCICAVLAWFFFCRAQKAPEPVRSPSASIPRGTASCNAPRDEEDCGCDDGVPMLAGSPIGSPAIPPHMSVNYGQIPQREACSVAQPAYGGGYY